ncbi:hypothetical protein ABF190_001393 [Flavobacterium psychrophilum]|uniref:hypothetical protein n=1 Tax=Flavobacterium psychrophilum TaxID=96345 RepID=UPI000B7C481B|nr:hypothetical protein [Flavobacterium psychrophilum]SNB12233.1 hypothetical protein FPC831_800007 [Flavobacterium psychrophilum]
MYGITDIGLNINDFIRARNQAKLRLTGESSEINTKFDEIANDLETKIGNPSSGSALVNALAPNLKSIHNRLVTAGVPVFEQGGVIKYVTENGNEFAKIENGVFSVTYTKGNIPNPSTYLDDAYIVNHINKFKIEGAGFIVIKSWTEGGDPLRKAWPSRKFVGLRSEMDAIIARYKASGNDWKILRDELNFEPSTNFSAEEIYYIKIDGNDTRFSFDVPNGNEPGAIVNEWVPGAYTKSGTSEAALIGSDNIIHNKSIDQLISNFAGKWEKIK